MTLVPEKRELFGEMTVEDNLLLGAFQRIAPGKRDHGATHGRGLRAVPAAAGALQSNSRARCRAASARCWLSVGR